MKQKLLLKAMLLLCALIAGSSSVWAQTTVKDNLTASDFAATGTTYTDFSDVSKTSSAVYAGNSAKDASGNIQLRSKNSNSGVVSTTTGGTVKSVKITVGSGENTIDVYGSNSAYTAASDLYGNNKGTKIGSLTGTGTITFPAETDYAYVGIRSYSGAIYLSSIEITWETSGGGDDPTISADPTSLSSFTYVEGNGPSAAQTISVSGSNLTDDITLLVDDDYEISTSQNSGYSDEVTLTQSDGAVSATNVYVRLKSGLAKGSHDGTIIISSEDATDVEVNLSGSVTGQLYAVTVASVLNGEIEADPTSAAEGAEVTLSYTPSSGYRLSAWDVYKTGDASTKVTVTNNKFTMPDYAVTVSATFEVIPTVTYTLATSVVPGRHYIIASGKTGTVRAMGYDKGNNRDAVSVSAVENQSTNTITVAEDAGVYEFLIEVEQLEMDKVDKGYYFTIYDESTTSTGYLYAASSGSNHLKTQGSNDENGDWAITIDENGVASVFAKQSSNRKVMQYNSSSTLFSCYATASQSDVYLFERVGDAGTQDFTVSINAACTDGKGNYYGTFSAPFAFTVPAGVTVSEIGIDEGKLDVEEYAADAVIPANTGVMISSATAGEKTFTSAKGGTSVKGANNRLRPACWEVTAKEMDDADENCQFYRLTMHNGTDIGFWWGAASGAAFDLDANKAYLAVPTGASAPSFLWFDNGSTGVDEIRGKMEEVRGDFFDLQGRKVANPTKGLYIVNGKKVVIK